MKSIKSNWNVSFYIVFSFISTWTLAISRGHIMYLTRKSEDSLHWFTALLASSEYTITDRVARKRLLWLFADQSFNAHARPLSKATCLILWLKFHLMWTNSVTWTYHYENTPIHIYRKFHLQNTEYFQIKNSNIFHISAQNIDCGYSLEPPRRGGSNEYPQSMLLSRNKKNNVYPCKPQFCYIKVGFEGVKII